MTRARDLRHFALAILTLGFLCAGFAQQHEPAQLSPEYQKWLDQDVHWIITRTERAEFLSLASDPARNKFVVDFWERHNPSPAAKENAFKQEHYRRLAFANEHFAAAKPGWTTDRGHIYIVYGPPDSIITHAAISGGHADLVWIYRNQHGRPASIQFVDDCNCGDYRLHSAVPLDDEQE